VRVLSRRTHESGDGVEFVTGDLATGDGLDAAMDGIATVVHCAGTAKGDADKARNLVRAASRAGARHLVYISVVRADRIPVVSRVDRAVFGYSAAKRAAGVPGVYVHASAVGRVVVAADPGPALPAGHPPAGRRRRGGLPHPAVRRGLPVLLVEGPALYDHELGDPHRALPVAG
jgi:NmrA-like family.